MKQQLKINTATDTSKVKIKLLGTDVGEPVESFVNVLDDIDLSVYTRNRCFRIFLSCKKGKNNPLIYCPEMSNLPTEASKSYYAERELLNFSLASKIYSKNEKFITLEFKKQFTIQAAPAAAAVRQSVENEEEESSSVSIIKIHNIFDENNSPPPLAYQKTTNERDKIECDCCKKSLAVKPDEPYASPEILNKFMKPYLKEDNKILCLKPKKEPHIYVIRTNSHNCLFKDDPQNPHKFNNVFFVIDTRNSLLFFKCFDEVCADKISSMHFKNYIKYKNDVLNVTLDSLFLK